MQPFSPFILLKDKKRIFCLCPVYLAFAWDAWLELALVAVVAWLKLALVAVGAVEGCRQLDIA